MTTATSPEGLNSDQFPTFWEIAFPFVKTKVNILSPHYALLKVKHEPSLGGGVKAYITNLLSLGNSDIKCQMHKLPSTLVLTPAGIHLAVSTLELLLCRLHLGHIFFVNTSARELLFIFIKSKIQVGGKKKQTYNARTSQKLLCCSLFPGRRMQYGFEEQTWGPY